MSTPTASPFEDAMLEEARAEVIQADHKATLVLTALGVGGGALLGGVIAGDWEPAKYEAPGEAIWWLAAALAALAITAAASAVWPRWPREKNSNDVFYWGHVVRYETVAELTAALDRQALNGDVRGRHQLHHLSRIVRRKYNLIRVAMLLVAASSLFFALAALTG